MTRRAYAPRRSTVDLIGAVSAIAGVARVHSIAPSRGAFVNRPSRLRITFDPDSAAGRDTWDVMAGVLTRAAVIRASAAGRSYVDVSLPVARAFVAAAGHARAIAYAADRGRRDGTGAGEWFAQDAFGGRVTRGAAESAERILAGIADGDPAVTDGLPFADLSGETAGTLTGPALVDDARYAGGLQHSDRHDLYAETFRETCDACRFTADAFTDVCDAYESAYATAAAETVERLARLEIER